MLLDSVLARKGSRGRRVLLLGSLIIHAGFAVGLIVWSFVHVDEVTPPVTALVWNGHGTPITVSFGGGGGGGQKPKARFKDDNKDKPKRTRNNELVQPDKAPDKISDSDTDSAVDTSTDSDIGGGGDDDGTCTGPNCDGTPCTGPSCGGPPCVGPDCGSGGGGVQATPVEVEKPKNLPHDLDAEVTYRVDPRLPDFVKSRHASGTKELFIAKMCIDRGGRVISVDVKKGVDGADDLITDTLRTWRYKPQPVPVCFPVNLEFAFE